MSTSAREEKAQLDIISGPSKDGLAESLLSGRLVAFTLEGALGLEIRMTGLERLLEHREADPDDERTLWKVYGIVIASDTTLFPRPIPVVIRYNTRNRYGYVETR